MDEGKSRIGKAAHEEHGAVNEEDVKWHLKQNLVIISPLQHI